MRLERVPVLSLAAMAKSFNIFGISHPCLYNLKSVCSKQSLKSYRVFTF